MRKLATIRRIDNIEPIEGADLVEQLTIGGWNLVSGKGNFKVNDLCVYFEIDSMLPRKSWNEFLFNEPDKQTVRLKTKKIRGVVSQGLALPVKELNIPEELLFEGSDLSEYLNIEKYEPVISAQLQGMVKGNFPSEIQKTDEERWQNFPHIFNELVENDLEMVGRTKFDGSSCTFYYINGVFGVCSRNLDLKETEGNTYWKIARELDIENKLKQYISSIISQQYNFSIPIQDVFIQGELIGEGIQKNRMGLKGHSIRLFNMGFPNSLLNAMDKTLVEFCKLYDIPIATEIFRGKIKDKFNSIQEMSAFADTIKYDNGHPAEGIVWRRTDWGNSKVLKSRLSFKTISNKFLIKIGE